MHDSTIREVTFDDLSRASFMFRYEFLTDACELFQRFWEMSGDGIYCDVVAMISDGPGHSSGTAYLDTDASTDFIDYLMRENIVEWRYMRETLQHLDPVRTSTAAA